MSEIVEITPAQPNNSGVSQKNKICIQCGKQLKKSQYIYCSNKCQSLYRYKKYINEWLSGENKIIKNGAVPKLIRRYLIDLRGNKCELCGWNKINPVTKNVPLEIHHIDGDCFNNHISNLQILCPNCHSITDNYKALNKKCTRNKNI